MDSKEKAKIAERFNMASNASVRSPHGITAIVDSVFDVPGLLEEIERLEKIINDNATYEKERHNFW